MTSTFINPVINPDQTLGVTVFNETEPVRHWPLASVDEVDSVIRAIYKQVLGNAYVMESERLPMLESQFLRGELSVTAFVRQIAHSDLYRTRFFEGNSRNRFIELNFKHFLGRAPESVAEIATHSAILDSHGYEAEIDSYLDGEEYAQAFGDDMVPYYRGFKTGAGTKLVGFTHIFPLLRGASSSDKAMTNKAARLTSVLFSDRASSVVSPTGATSRRGSGIPLTTGNWLQNIFSPPPAKREEPTPSAASPFAGMGDAALVEKAQAQATLIEQLQAQIDERRSLSTMGAVMLRKGQRPAGEVAATPQAFFPSGNSALEQKVNEQAQIVEQLRGELMSAMSLANVAEFKLNKWRRRFS